MSKKSLLLFYLCMFLACTEWIQAQNTDVSGIVVYAEDGEPVIGANVQVRVLNKALSQILTGNSC